MHTISSHNNAFYYFFPRPAVLAYRAHENPPDGAHSEEVIDEPFEEKVDSRVSDSLWPQDGQATSFLSLLRKHKYSKTFPQVLHLNSYIGI